MKTRTCILTVLTASLCYLVNAQTFQKGIVRTVGSHVANGKIRKGVRLTNVIVTADAGNEVMTDNEGMFTLAIPRKTYFLKNVYKQGYRLADAEALSRQYYRSENPHEIIMENIAQSTETLLTQQKKKNAVMQNQLKLKQDELKQLRKDKQIDEEEYNRRIAELETHTEKMQERVEELALRFSKIDFEQIDELESQVLYFIDEGLLDSADSLLRTMGDIRQAVDTHCKQAEKLYQDKQRHPERSDFYEGKISRHKAEGKSLAMFCYDYYSIAQLRFDIASAAEYIELRASIDTSEVRWQMDAAAFHTRERNTERATEIYKRLTAWLRPRAMAEPTLWDASFSAALNNLAIIYNDCGKIEQAEQLYRESLSIRQRLAMTNSEAFSPYVAQTQNNLGVLFYMTKRAKQAEKLFTAALAVRRSLCEKDPMRYGAEKAATLGNLASVYAEAKQYERSKAMYEEALDTYLQLTEKGFSKYENDRAAMLNNVAVICRLQGDLDGCEKKWWDALGTYSRLTQVNPQRYTALLRQTLDNLMSIYDNDSRECNEKRLAVYRLLAGNMPDDYAPMAAQLMNTLAAQYDKEQMPKESEALYMECLSIYEKLSEREPSKYTPYVARTLGNISFHLILKKEFQKAEIYARKGISADSSKTFIKANLAAAQLLQGHFEDAKTIYVTNKDTLRNSFLEDLYLFRERDIIPEGQKSNVETIINLLNN